MGEPATYVRFSLFLLLSMVIVGGAPVLAERSQKKVLVLYSTGRDAAVSLAGERELPRLLDNGLDRQLDFYAEHLDTGRFSNPGYRSAFSEFLRFKYRGLKFDLVIAVLDTAIEFLDLHRDDLFPDTPVVFFGNVDTGRRMSNATGLIAARDFTSTIRLATTLQPDTTDVFVISGAAPRDRTLEEEARAQLKTFEPTLRITYLAGLPTEELTDRLSALPQHAIAFYLLVYQDGSGQTFQPIDYLERIAAAANRPTYSWVNSALDRGVVGGSMQRIETQIAATADLALRVLRGEAANAIPVAMLNLHSNEVDWRQLQRWGIRESRVPAGTVVHFREVSVFERYTGYILGAVAIVLLQSALIVGLLVQRRRRQRAEQEVLRGQAALRASSERIRNLGRRLLNAHEVERTHLARELHDDLGQQATLLAMDLQALRDSFQQRPIERDRLVHAALDRAQNIARAVHDLSSRLHPAKLRLMGLIKALDGLRRDLAETGVAITFSYTDVPQTIPEDVTLCLFRAAQEALQNAIRHSDADEISMELRGGADTLTLVVADDGVGFDVEAAWSKGLGLVSMSERLASVGGRLTVQAKRTEGARLEITVPVAVERSLFDSVPTLYADD